MFQRRECGGFVQPAGLMQRPERGERSRPTGQQGAELRLNLRRPAPAEHAGGGLAVPLVRMRQEREQFVRAFAREVHVLLQRGLFATQAVDAAGRGIDLTLVMLPVRDVVLVEIRDMQRAVRRIHDEHGTEAFIRTPQHLIQITRAESRAARLPLGRDEQTVNRIYPEHLALPRRRERGAFDHRDAVREALDGRGEFHPRQFAKGIRVARRAELARVHALFHVVAALLIMPAARLGAVVTAEEPALAIELQPEDIATAFGEQFVNARLGMITPDHAAFEIDSFRARRIETGPHHATGGRAALAAVNPAVRSPHQTVRDGMCVLQTEAREMHRGRSIRHVIAIAIGIEEQIRRVHDPDTIATGQDGIGHVQSINEHLVLVERAIAIRVFVNGNHITAAIMIRRRRRNLVVVGAVILVAAEHLHAGGIRILTILRDPEPAARVIAQVRRLRDERFMQQLLDDEIIGGFELRRGFCRRKLRAVDELCRFAEHAVALVILVERSARRLLFERDPLGPRRIVACAPFPVAFEHALVEVIHDERRFAEEATGTGHVVNTDGDFVPLALAQETGRNLVAMIARSSAAELRGEGSASTDARAVNEYLVSIGETADVQRDGFGEQVPLVRREEAVMRLEPRTIPGEAVVVACGGWAVGLPRAGHADGWPAPGHRLGGEFRSDQPGAGDESKNQQVAIHQHLGRSTDASDGRSHSCVAY